MSLACVYHPTNGMEVVSEEVFEQRLKSGDWYAHPDEAKAALADSLAATKQKRKDDKDKTL